MSINGTRLNEHLAQLAAIGATPEGGVTRLSLTPEYLTARDMVAAWMGEAGLTVHVDSVGNLIGRREGSAPDLAAIVLGSHIDTVINGGRFDGSLGVLGAVEVAATLLEQSEILRHPLEIISFVEEEGTRWGMNMLGSSAMLGRRDPSTLMHLTDRQGLTMAEGFRAAGLDPDRFSEARRGPGEFRAYLELHIEQGAVLESEDQPVGVVTGIAGPLFLAVRMVGRTDHAGATPMRLRRDALAAAAEVVLRAREVAMATSPTAVATVGRLEVKPGAVNAVPGEVYFTLDIRDIYEENRDRMEAELRASVLKAAQPANLEYSIQETARHQPVLLPSGMVELVSEAARQAGVPAHRLPSGAGHDAQVMASAVDAGMIFVRSQAGISHSPREFSSAADICLGVEVLYQAVRLLDGQEARRTSGG